MENGKMTLDTIDTSPEERKWWVENRYPMTVVSDRYGGEYSGGLFVAFPVEYHSIPGNGPDGSDVECMDFWKGYGGYVGLGTSPSLAARHLAECIENGIHYNELWNEPTETPEEHDELFWKGFNMENII